MPLRGSIVWKRWCRVSWPAMPSACASSLRKRRRWPRAGPGGSVYLTKKHISRRTLLRGLGVGVSLPLLDAMIPAGVALAQTAAAPRPRLGFFYFPHGAVMEKWTPATTGRDFQLNEINQSLTAFKDQLTVLSNLGNR